MERAPNDSGEPRRGPPASPATIEYSPDALEAVRTAAVDGLYKLARAGLDVGGLLLGQRDGGKVRILDSRPIACEHSAGPAFLLSQKDEAGLDAQLSSLRAEAAAGGPALVGWYRSNTRGGLHLTQADLALWDRCCPEPWQVALVLHPERMKPTRAAFFVRPPGGWADEPSPCSVFEVAPLFTTPRAPAPQPDAAPASEPAAPAATQEDAAAGQLSRAAVAASHRPGFWFMFALAWCIAAGSLAFALRDYWLPPNVSPLPLRLAESSGQVFVQWDPADARVRAVESGALEVDDGGRHAVYQLAPEQARGGSLTYVRTSHDVAVRLRLFLPHGRRLEGASRLVAPQVENPPALPPGDRGASGRVPQGPAPAAAAAP